MDFKKRWCLLLTILVIICLLITWERLSGCQPCIIKYREESNVPDKITEQEQHRSFKDDHAYGRTFLTLPGVVFDCITWDVIRNYTKTEFELLPLTVSLPEKNGEDAMARKQTFQKIFDKRDWPADDPSYGDLKASGPGAMMRNAQGAVAVLHSLITKLKTHLQKSVISILDVPCGDLQWMSRFLLTRMDIEYTGADIVPDIITHHRKKFRHFKNANFIELDVVSNFVNRSFDLIFCRNMLQHLWMSDALAVLKQFSNSGSLFLLLTTFVDTDENRDVDRSELGGRKSNYNLEISPFSLQPPICTSYDWSVEHLSLWSLPLLQKRLYKSGQEK